MKMPAFQFYPADWRKDPGVQALSRHDRSVWFDMLCIMHESDERGVLLLAGRPVPEEALARMLNLDNQTFNQTLTNILTYGVASRRQSDGAIYSRRMVKDENLCQTRREAGKKGGNPGLVNQKPKQNPTTRDNQNPTPSSSTSSSTTDDERTGGQAGEESALPLQANPGGKAVGGPARAVPADASPVFTMQGFREFVKSIGFGHVDIGLYLLQIQRKAEALPPRPTTRPSGSKEASWEDFIENYLNNDKRNRCLLLPETEEAAPPNRRLQVVPTPTTMQGDLRKIAASQQAPII